MEALGAPVHSGRGELIAGRYRIERVLGQGGMGVVHLASDALTGQRLAIKRTLPGSGWKSHELFKREFHTLHGLRHPNIVEVYDYGRDRDRWFYTMELLEGSDLGTAAPLPWRKVCSYLRQIAAVLGMLHARRLLHRDVSPRNIWILPDGRLKLLDFGALTTFGIPTDVVGTPPMIAPEWLSARSSGVHVDQRADLYGLGALGYWLLTGVHACYATTPADGVRGLPQLPQPPSCIAIHSEIPSELDGLIAALLRRDPTTRPEDTESVIDRIDAIAGPALEPVEHAAHSYLRSKAFVGRRYELQRIELLLRGEDVGAHAVVALGAAGQGRSRFLEELALLGSLSGAASVLVRASEPERPYALANALVLQLFDRMPEHALAAAKPRESVLGLLSRELQARLGLASHELAPSRRSELQQVLTDWVFALAAERNVLLLIDDVESSDADTAIWLGFLARHCNARRLILVLALRDDAGAHSTLPLQLLFNTADRLTLQPLTVAEVEQLLCSVFGPVDYLARTAQAIYAASQGNPAHCLELLEYLVERRLARFREGGWTLPGLLSEAELPQHRSGMHLARFDALSEPAQRLAEVLSVAECPLTRADCAAVSELSEGDTAAALVELVLGGVLVESDRGYAFVHASVRQHACSLLIEARSRRSHAQLGAALLARARDPVDALRAGLHLFRAGDRVRGEELTARAVEFLFGRDRERLAESIPLMEAALELFRAADCDVETLAGPLAVLARASGIFDHRLAARYGVEALATLERVLYLDRARRLRPYVGGRLALLAALACAALHRRGSVGELAHRLAHSAGMLNGVATASLDLVTTARCARAIEPLAVLGPRHVAGFMHRGMLAITRMATERHAEALAGTSEFARVAKSGVHLFGMTEQTRRDAITGSQLAVGILECWRMNEAALDNAAHIESFGSIDAMIADHLRAVCHSLRGERALAAEYQRRFETRALSAGAAWQVVTLGPIDAHLMALWTHDALLGKRAAAELERLSQDLPALRHEARHARATYLALCGRYREVIDVLQTSDAPRQLLGWTRAQGILARAHNRLGEHARAREVCRAALADRSEEDLTFVALNLHVQLELVLAEAALGELDGARAGAKRLLAQHAGRVGPLALGAIHETRARVALFERDFEVARLHCTAMRRAYAPTQSATLFELTDQLSDQIALAEHGERPVVHDVSALLADDAELITRVHLFGKQAERRWAARARRGLRIALELTGAQSGFVIAPAAHGAGVYAEECEPEAQVVEWARALRGVGVEQTGARGETKLGCSAELQRGETCHCAFVIRPDTGEVEAPAVLVLGFRESSTRPPQQRVLAILTGALQDTLA